MAVSLPRFYKLSNPSKKKSAISKKYGVRGTFKRDYMKAVDKAYKAAKKKRSGPLTKAQRAYRKEWHKTHKISKPKKNPSTKKRKLSPKQIAIFGTPRQKAALRAKRKNPSIRRTKKALKKAGWETKGMLPTKRWLKASKAKKAARTPRQKAALRASRSRKRVNAGKNSVRKSLKAYKKTFTKPSKIMNFHTGYNRKRKRKNIGEIVSVHLLGNSGTRRKNTGMAKKRLKKTASAKAARRAYRRRKIGNRSPVARRRHSSRHSNLIYRMKRLNRGQRRNAGIGSLTSGVLGKTVGFITGLLGARYLTQLVLQGNNTGIMGYGGNIIASVALGFAAGKVTKNKDFGTTVMVGGIASTLLRYISENTSYGSVIQASLSGAGKSGDVGMGLITDSSFYTPQTFAAGSMTNAVVPRAVTGYVSAQIAQSQAMAKAGSPKSGMGRTRRAVM